jgi:hypothetical protein
MPPTAVVPTEPPSTPIARVQDPDAELKALRAVEPDTAPPKDEANNPLAQEQWAFALDYKSSRAQFKNKILSIAERVEVGLLQSRLARLTPWEAIDEDTRYLLSVIAHLTVSLVEKPAWFKASEMKDVAFLYTVYTEVAKHEAYFRGDRPSQKVGA